MKVVVKLKDPDAIREAVRDAVDRATKPLGLTVHAAEAAFDVASQQIASFAAKWVENNKHFRIEFDTDAGTARVLPRDEKEGWNG